MTDRRLNRIRFVTQHFRELQGLRHRVPLGLLLLSVGGTVYFDNLGFVLLRLAFAYGAITLAVSARAYYRKVYGEVEPIPLFEPETVPSLSIYSPGVAAPLTPGLRESVAGRRLILTIGSALALYFLLRAFSPTLDFIVDESRVQPPWESGVVYFSGSSELVITPSTDKAALGQLLYALSGAFAVATWIGRDRRRSQIHHLGLGLALLGIAALGARLGSLLASPDWSFPLSRWLVPAAIHLWIALPVCGLSLIVAGLLDHWQLARALRPARRSLEAA